MPRHARLCYLLVYPLLFAAAPVLGIAAHNTGQYRSSDLAAVLTRLSAPHGSCDGDRVRAAAAGVRVVEIEPGFVDTPMTAT